MQLFIRKIPRPLAARIDIAVSAVADSYTNIRALVPVANTSSARLAGMDDRTAFIK